MQHLDEMVCLLYIERQLDRARAQEVSAHTQDCNQCRLLLRAIERESRLLTRAMLEENEALPLRLAQFQARARKSMQCIWGLPLGLAEGVRKGETTEVDSGENIKGDVFMFSHHTGIDGTVDGDVYLFTQDANVGGPVKGDVIAFAQSLRVTGEVDGNIRSFTNNLTVTGNVTRNVLAFQEILNLDPSGKVGGSLT